MKARNVFWARESLLASRKFRKLPSVTIVPQNDRDNGMNIQLKSLVAIGIQRINVVQNSPYPWLLMASKELHKVTQNPEYDQGQDKNVGAGSVGYIQCICASGYDTNSAECWLPVPD